MAPHWLRQTAALTRKNIILAWRTRRLTACELLSPFFIMALVGIMGLASNSAPPSPAPEPVMTLKSERSMSPCMVFGSPDDGRGQPLSDAWCVPILFAPSTSADVGTIMSMMAERNGYDAPSLVSAVEAPLSGVPTACGGQLADDAASELDQARACMLGFETVHDLRQWVAANPGRAGIGVVFGDTTVVEQPDGSIEVAEVITDALPSQHIKYELWFNATALQLKWYSDYGADALGAFADARSASRDPQIKDTSLMLTVQRAVDEAIVGWHASKAGRSASDVSITLGVTAFPRLSDGLPLSSRLGNLAAFLSLAPSFFGMLTRITHEKEKHITGTMRSVGLSQAAYWLANWLHATVISLLTCAVAHVTGAAFRLPLFVHSDALLLFLILLIYSLSMAAYAFAISSTLCRVKTAALLGFAAFIPCVTLMVLSGIWEGTTYLWWEPAFPPVVTGLLAWLLPPFSLSKLLADASEMTALTPYMDSPTADVVVRARDTFSWASLSNYQLNRTATMTFDPLVDDPNLGWYIPPPPAEALGQLVLCALFFGILALYLVQVINDGDTRPQSALFFLTRAYWRGDALTNTGAQEHLRRVLRDSNLAEQPGIDADVAAEIVSVCTERTTGGLGTAESSSAGPPTKESITAVELLNAQRIFTAWTWVDSKSVPGGKDFVKLRTEAVKGVTLRMDASQCFALLGHNGAGKTTTIKLATGQIATSSRESDVYVHGLSVSSQTDAVRAMLGICPQHDILYHELSAQEHLELYGSIKGLSRMELTQRVPELLAGVTLAYAATRPAGPYSGGMKRRLSCAIAMIGSPKFIVLDEPTTGMDPMNRRAVWNQIAEVKINRTVLLTTHSMEEADALGDRIGIMSSGRLVALGTGLHLKNKFGDGYRIKLVAPKSCRAKIRQHVAELVPSARLDRDDGGDMIFSIEEAGAVADAPQLFSFVEEVADGKHAGLLLNDWGVSHTTLEDVFLKLKREYEGKSDGEMFWERLQMPFYWEPPGKHEETIEFWQAGTPYEHVAQDGMEYMVSPDKLPSAEKWRFLKRQLRPEIWLWVRLEKKYLTAEQKKQMQETILVHLNRPSRGLLTGWGVTLAPDGTEVAQDGTLILPDGPVKVENPSQYPVVAEVAVNSMAQKAGLRRGDCIKMINWNLCMTSAEAQRKLLQRKHDVHLRVIRQTKPSERRRKLKPRQVRALLNRTLSLQRRQCCLVIVAMIIPIICIWGVAWYKFAIVDLTGDVLEARIAVEARAGAYGCSNSSAQLQTMCSARLSTAPSGPYFSCNWCEKSWARYPTLNGLEIDQCSDEVVNDLYPGAKGDQCRSTYFGGDSYETVDFSVCIAGVGRPYASASALPEWCNCTSEAFQGIVRGTPYCLLNTRLSNGVALDPQPVKVLRDLSDPQAGFTYQLQSVPEFLPDDWRHYIGWHVAVAAPETLPVGSMSGHTDGFLGSFANPANASEAVYSSVSSMVQISGLMQYLPRGFPDASPNSPEDTAVTEPCLASSQALTCCATVMRRPIRLLAPPGSTSNQGCFDAVEEQANTLPLTKSVCGSCAELSGDTYEEGRIFDPPLISACVDYWPPPGMVTITYDINASSLQSFCHSASCTMSRCEPDPITSSMRNPRCDNIQPNMTDHCALTKQAVSAACAGGTMWTHPASKKLLAMLWSKHQGLLPAGSTQAGVDTNVGALLGLAFDHASTWTAALGQTFDPMTSCAPPFCFDFASAPVGGGSWNCAASSPDLDSLSYLYPCAVEYASSYTIAGQPSYSVAEGQLCREAYAIMATVYPGWSGSGSDWSVVPECAPSSLDGAHFTSCADCVPTQCPQIPHHVTPLYQPTVSLRNVTARVLASQFAVRDGTPLPDRPQQIARYRDPLPDQQQSAPVSHALEKIFPSAALEVAEVDLQALNMSVNIASFWGDAADWPYVRAPDAWNVGAGDTQFQIVKFQQGLRKVRWINSGGMGSILLNWMTNALLRSGLDPSLQVTVGMRPFPYERQIELTLDLEDDLSGSFVRLVDLIVPLASSFAFPLLAATVVIEKESKLRSLMRIMGLKMRWYWTAEWLFNSVFVLFINLVIIAVAFLRDLSFIERSIGTVVIVQICWCQAMVAMSMSSAWLYNRLVTSYVVNALLIIVPWLVCFMVNQSLRASDVFPTGSFLFAPIAYFRAIHLLVTRSYTIDAVFQGEMGSIILMLLVDTVVYALTSATLDFAYQRRIRMADSPMRFSFAMLLGRAAKRPAAPAPAWPEEHAGLYDEEDSDVAAARRAAESQPARAPHECDPVEIVKLNKIFPGGKLAVRNLSLTLFQDECFGLLGPNGAGKTTTISILTGLYPPTGGTARVCGFDIVKQLDKVYRSVGICPQFELLWQDLTVLETILFYTRLRGVAPSQAYNAAIDLLLNVDLAHVQRRYVRSLSGGMKRRVASAIALVGDPRVVFLDEPTTGLDPETRRIIWSLVDFFKADRCTILTTHSMEEADALCSRIGIMAHGALRCLGPSLHLKAKFERGYKVELTTDLGHTSAATAFMKSVIPTIKLVKDYAGVLTFQVAAGPAQEQVRVSELFTVMSQRPASAGIRNWALRQTSLEDVFMVVAGSATEQERLREQEAQRAIIVESGMWTTASA